MSEMVTPEDLVNINEKIKATAEDTTPYLVKKDDTLHVMGDANKTEVKKGDYTIKFRYPRSAFAEIPAGAREVGEFVVFAVTYPEVTITPRRDIKIIAEIFKLKPFLNTLSEDGKVEERTEEEMFMIVADAGEEMLLAVYNLVATFLGIDDIAGEYMLPGSVITALAQIVETHPEIFNEADVFFG